MPVPPRTLRVSAHADARQARAELEGVQLVGRQLGRFRAEMEKDAAAQRAALQPVGGAAAGGVTATGVLKGGGLCLRSQEDGLYVVIGGGMQVYVGSP